MRPAAATNGLARLDSFDHAAVHRFIPAEFSRASVLETLPLPSNVLADLSELDAATNEHKIAERGRSAGIGPGELLYGVPEAHIVNAAFTHPGPYGGRFHGPLRGAWYAGIEMETSIAEVSFHKSRFLANARIIGEHPFDYVDFLADFSGMFHRLDAAEGEACLEPGPIPWCYAAPQAWLTNFCTKDRTASFIRAFAMPREPALRVSGPRWCFTRAAEARIESLSRRGKARSRFSRFRRSQG